MEWSKILLYSILEWKKNPFHSISYGHPNVYNEKNQGENQKYTIERKLISLDISKKAIICENFNAHNLWWNSKIQNSIHANALIS